MQVGVPKSTGPRAVRVDTHLHLSHWWPDFPHTAYRPDVDYTVRGLLAEMDRSSIDYGVIIQLHEAPSVKKGLEEGRRNAKAAKGRLLPVTTVDPTRGEEEVREAIDLWEQDTSIRGVKLYPGYQAFYVHDRRVEPILEFAHRRKIPVLVHQGDTLETNGLVKYARPIELDEVAVRFRDVQFVLCHLGNPWIDEAAEILWKNSNVYTDCSGLLAHPSAPLFRRMVKQCAARLEQAVVTVGRADQFLYGSDWPLEELKVATGVVESLDLPEEYRRMILGENARRLFGLPERPPHRPGAS